MGATLEFWSIPASVADALTPPADTRNIDALIEIIRSGEQVGSVTVNAVVVDDLAQRLMDAGFADWLQSRVLMPEPSERPTVGLVASIDLYQAIERLTMLTDAESDDLAPWSDMLEAAREAQWREGALGTVWA